jgi:hypothetical protein
MLVLTEEQRLSLACLDWLTSPEAARTGRTQLMAVAILRTAARHPGKAQPLIDHYPGVTGAHAIRSMVLSMLHLFELKEFATLTQTTITLTPPDATGERHAAYDRSRMALLAL